MQSWLQAGWNDQSMALLERVSSFPWDCLRPGHGALDGSPRSHQGFASGSFPPGRLGKAVAAWLLCALPADPGTAQGWHWDLLELKAAPWQHTFVTSLSLGQPKEEPESRGGKHPGGCKWSCSSFPSEQGVKPSLSWHTLPQIHPPAVKSS